MQKREQQTNENAVDISPEFWSIKEFSQYLGLKPSTVYAWVREESIPYYKIGRLVRFRKSEIDEWIAQKRIGGEGVKAGAKNTATPRTRKRPFTDIDRIVRMAVDGVKGRGYTKSTGKPDQVKGLGREVPDGTV